MTLADSLVQTLTTLQKFELDINRALLYGEHGHSFDDVVAGCVSGKFDLYTLPNSIIVMDLHVYPQYKSYHVFLACGDMAEVMAAQDTLLVTEAKLRGATRLTLTGRKGWLRQLETAGWTPTVVAMKKEISYGENIRDKDRAGNRPASRGKL